MKEKKNIFLYVIITLLVALIVFLGILLVRKDKSLSSEERKDDKVEVQDNNIENDTMPSENLEPDIEEVPQIVIYNRDEVFTKLTGIWKFVYEDGTNYAIKVYVDEIGTDRFSLGQYGTDAGIYGEVTDIKHKNDYVYQLTVFSAGCHGEFCLEESDDTTYSIDIDVSNIDNNEIKVTTNNITNTYKYVAKTWEDAESSFSY